MATIAYVLNRSFTEISNRGARYFGVVLTQVSHQFVKYLYGQKADQVQTFGTFSHPLNIAWMSISCTDSEERALAMAMVIMGANMAGIYGAQLYRSDDEPRYRRAFTVCIGVLAFGTFLAVVRKVDEVFLRRRGLGPLETESNSDDREVYDELKAPGPPPSNSLPQPTHTDADRKPSLVTET